MTGSPVIAPIWRASIDFPAPPEPTTATRSIPPSLPLVALRGSEMVAGTPDGAALLVVRPNDRGHLLG